MHGVRKGGRAEDVQKQVQLPAACVPLSRGPTAQGLPVSGVSEGVLAAGQDEESYEDGA